MPTGLVDCRKTTADSERRGTTTTTTTTKKRSRSAVEGEARWNSLKKRRKKGRLKAVRKRRQGRAGGEGGKGSGGNTRSGGREKRGVERLSDLRFARSRR